MMGKRARQDKSKIGNIQQFQGGRLSQKTFPCMQWLWWSLQVKICRLWYLRNSIQTQRRLEGYCRDLPYTLRHTVSEGAQAMRLALLVRLLLQWKQIENWAFHCLPIFAFPLSFSVSLSAKRQNAKPDKLQN